jgi:hypothetical protein
MLADVCNRSKAGRSTAVHAGSPAAVAGMPAASSAATSAGNRLPEIVSAAVSPPRTPDTYGDLL